MLNKKNILKMLCIMTFCFGFIGCDTGNTGNTTKTEDNTNKGNNSGSGLTAISAEFTVSPCVIYIYCNGNFTFFVNGGFEEPRGFTVKKNGSKVSINSNMGADGGNNFFEIHMDGVVGANFQSNDIITVSYDGVTGAFAGKVKAFTDLNATFKQ